MAALQGRRGEDKEDKEQRVDNKSQQDTEERPGGVVGSILHEKRVQGRLLKGIVPNYCDKPPTIQRWLLVVQEYSLPEWVNV